MGLMALLPPRRKCVLEIFITHKNPPSSVGFEPATKYPMGPVASTLTTRLPRAFFSYMRESLSVVRRVEFISDKKLYIILRGCWCNIIVLNVHAPCEDKGDDVKDSFYKELRHVFDQFPRYDMNILLGDFNTKVDRENIFKPTIGKEFTWNQ
jgi:hypothetical protein